MYSCTFKGLPPSQLGIVGYLALMNHYSKGAFYPLGGPSEIAFQIIPIIERYGGRVLVDAQVTKILTDQTGKANGTYWFQQYFIRSLNTL